MTGVRAPALRLAAWTLLIAGCANLGAGPDSASTRPSLILHDWFGAGPVPTPSFIREHRKFLDSGLFDGIAVYVRTADESLNVSATVFTERRLEYRAVANALAPIRGLRFENLKENFAAVVGGAPPDFAEDWSVPVANFGVLARAAREAGLRGIYFDNEAYSVPWTDYPRGVKHPRKPLGEYVELARQRGRELMAAMVAEFPDIVVIVLHGPYLSEPKAPEDLFPQWQSANELTGPFFAGMVEAPGETATVVDGGELYHLRGEAQFRRSRRWRKSVLPSDEIDCAFLPPALRARWEGRVSIGFGVIDRPFAGRKMDHGILAETLAAALRQVDRYAWFYVEGPSFLVPPEEGGADADWTGAIRAARAAAAR